MKIFKKHFELKNSLQAGDIIAGENKIRSSHGFNYN